MSKLFATFKVWVVCWPAAIAKEYGDEIKPLMPVSCPPEEKAYVLIREKGRKRRRSVMVDPWAIFATRAEAAAWSNEQGFQGHFLVRRAYLNVGAKI